VLIVTEVMTRADGGPAIRQQALVDSDMWSTCSFLPDGPVPRRSAWNRPQSARSGRMGCPSRPARHLRVLSHSTVTHHALRSLPTRTTAVERHGTASAFSSLASLLWSSWGVDSSWSRGAQEVCCRRTRASRSGHSPRRVGPGFRVIGRIPWSHQVRRGPVVHREGDDGLRATR
jgi:hypothetical protein